MTREHTGTSLPAATPIAARPRPARPYTPLSNPADRTNPASVALWPTDACAAAKKMLFVNGEPIVIVHQPAATPTAT